MPTAEPTDAELCARAREGDRTAAEALVLRHEGLVHAAVTKLSLGSEVDIHDLQQAGRMAVARAAVKWNPASDTGSKFSTYCFVAVRHAVGKELDRQQRQMWDMTTVDPTPGRPAEGEFKFDQLTAPGPAAQIDFGPVLAQLRPFHARLLTAYFGLDGECPDARRDRERLPGAGTGYVGRQFGLNAGQADWLLGQALLACRRVLRGEEPYPARHAGEDTGQAA